MTSPRTYGRKVVSVTVPSRVRGEEIPMGAEGILALEQLIIDTAALAGLDATAPMRRDVTVVIRKKRRAKRGTP